MFFNVGLNEFEKHKRMFTKLPEFVACNLLVLQRLVKCSFNDTEILYMVIDILMVLKAESSTFREFCEKCMKSLFLTQIVRFFSSKNNLILTDMRRRMNEENIPVW